MPDNSGVVITDAHSVKTNVTQLHIQGKSPTVYQFNLTVTDEHNLTSSDVVLVTVTKGWSLCTACMCVCLCKWVCQYMCVCFSV